MLVMPPIEMVFQALYKTDVPPTTLDELRNVLHYIKCVYPFVTLLLMSVADRTWKAVLYKRSKRTFGPATVRPCPTPISITSFHEAGLVIE